MKHLLTISILLLFTLLTYATTSEYTLKKVILITRHGDRTPMRGFPNTHAWTYPGELTGEGMNQLYKLGLKMREKYVDDLGFLSAVYNKSQLYVRSTDKERTLQSAQSFLMGLYPAGTGPSTASNSEAWYGDLYPGYHNDFNDDGDALPGRIQTIPIHTVQKKHDLLLHQYKNCEKLSQMRKEFKKQDEWIQKEKESQGLLRELERITGAKTLRLKDVGSVYHALKADTVHNKVQHDISRELKKELIDTKDWLLRRKFFNRKMGRLGAGMLLKHIVEEMKGQTSFKDEPKFIYYSAHDGTLLALLTALGLEDYGVPHYASYMVFESYENEKGETFVELTYTGDPVLEKCTGKCHVDTFHSIVFDGISEYQYFSEECDYQVPKVEKVMNYEITVAIVAVVILIMGALNLARQKKQKVN